MCGLGAAGGDRPVPQSSPCGELTAAERFPTLTVLRSKGIHKFTFQMNDEEKAVVAENCRTLLRQAAELAGRRRPPLVLDRGARLPPGLAPEELAPFWTKRPRAWRWCSPATVCRRRWSAGQTTITHMVKEKHPYDRGVTAAGRSNFNPAAPGVNSGGCFLLRAEAVLADGLERGRLQIHALVAVSGLK